MCVCVCVHTFQHFVSAEWLDGQHTTPRCENEPMTEPAGGKTWMKSGLSARRALGQGVTDKRFLNNILYCVNFRYELFHECWSKSGEIFTCPSGLVFLDITWRGNSIL